MPNKAKAAPLLSGLSAIAADYDVLLCDVWGVIHNGVRHFAPAIDALIRFRAQGGLVVLLTNAARPHHIILQQLQSLNVPQAAFDGIVTSGDVTRGLIAARAGKNLWHIGPERDLTLFEGLDAPLGTVANSEYVVCTGLLDDETQTAADYAEELAAIAARHLPMICANPDLVADRGGRLIPCAGAIAAAYEALGGDVTYSGKPYAPIYQAAMAMAETVSGKPITTQRVLAIGDALRTDIAGAVRFGVASLMVLDGIHAHETMGLNEAALTQWLMSQDHSPSLVIPTLRW